jgi:hypothetical protein
MKILIMFLLVAVFFQCYEAKTPEKEKQVGQIKNTGDEDWKVISFAANPDSFYVRVTYQEKYGSEKSIFCKAVFINDKSQQYKLISPLGTIILEKSNIVSISYNQVPIERGNL